MTARPGVVLAVRAADCVPVLLADPDAGVIGAAHAGRPGLVAEVVPHTVAAMRALGAADITAWVGPHVCGACYEVPAEMQAEVVAVEPAAGATTSWGTPSLDLGAGSPRPARARRASPSSTSAAAPASRPTCTPTAATATRPDGSPGWSAGCPRQGGDP